MGKNAKIVEEENTEELEEAKIEENASSEMEDAEVQELSNEIVDEDLIEVVGDADEVINEEESEVE